MCSRDSNPGGLRQRCCKAHCRSPTRPLIEPLSKRVLTAPSSNTGHSGTYQKGFGDEYGVKQEPPLYKRYNPCLQGKNPVKKVGHLDSNNNNDVLLSFIHDYDLVMILPTWSQDWRRVIIIILIVFNIFIITILTVNLSGNAVEWALQRIDQSLNEADADPPPTAKGHLELVSISILTRTCIALSLLVLPYWSADISLFCLDVQAMRWNGRCGESTSRWMRLRPTRPGPQRWSGINLNTTITTFNTLLLLLVWLLYC